MSIIRIQYFFIRTTSPKTPMKPESLLRKGLYYSMRVPCLHCNTCTTAPALPPCACLASCAAMNWSNSKVYGAQKEIYCVSCFWCTTCDQCRSL